MNRDLPLALTAPVIIIAFIGAMVWWGCTKARGQEHQHPPQDVELHEKFYSTWMMPDHPTTSCCNKRDCYPTEARFKDGQWFARRREDGKFIWIPPSKVEINRDSPDGRNHLCAPPGSIAGGDPVFCFIAGNGT